MVRGARSYRSISIACASAQQQISGASLLLSIHGQTEAQTDGWTDTQPLHRPCSAYHAGSVNNYTSDVVAITDVSLYTSGE